MLLVCGLVILNVLNETVGVSFIISAAKCDLELTDGRKGMLSSVSFVGILIAAQFWGYISDTRGRRKTIMYSMMVACVCTLISSFITNFWLFLVMRFLVGILYVIKLSKMCQQLSKCVKFSAFHHRPPPFMRIWANSVCLADEPPSFRTLAFLRDSVNSTFRVRSNSSKVHSIFF